MTPCVSVIVPAYNASLSLERAVTSVFESLSGYFDFEVIIVDDGSVDATQNVALLCQSVFGPDRVRLVRQENAGVSAARNAGIKVARGRFLALLDADGAVAQLPL